MAQAQSSAPSWKLLVAIGGAAVGGLLLARNIWSRAVAAAHSRAPRHIDQASAGLIEAIGETPLIELKSLSAATGCRILAKAEHLNPGGSVKDRPARWMILEAERKGDLVPGKGVIVEGTGGNTGVGLALLAAAKGYKSILVMPETISPEKIETMRTFGAKVVLQPVVPFSNPNHYFHVAERLAKETEGGFFTNQFENLANMRAHYESTGPEIWAQSGGRVDGVVVSAGTGGTIAGLSTFFKEKNPNCKAFLIDPPGSGLFSYVTTGEFKAEGSSITEGIGIMRRTANFAAAKLDGALFGTDRESVEMAYYLLRNEGIFVGPSAALNVVGAVKVARRLGAGHTIVTVLCDSGDRYRGKLYSKEFLATKNLLPEATGTAIDFVL